MTLALFCLMGFACGSLPNAYWIARGLQGIDIRTQGSGNVGATNVFRVLGRGPGLLVFALDFAKGWVPVALAGSLPEASVLGVGIAAILGHIFTPWLGFKGGKGVATGAGVLLAFSPALWAISLLIWLAVFYWTRIVSMASLLASGALAPFSLFLKMQLSTTLVFAALFLLVVWTHRQNLKRLGAGEEKRL